MDEQTRKQVVKQLDELRTAVSEHLGNEPRHHDPVAAHVEELRALVDDRASDNKEAQASATGLERRLLVWEAEHPQLTALAARVARVFEDAGL
ncbi:MAG: hypothetical protein RLZZ450_515 [Pseudomonadota bacterium]